MTLLSDLPPGPGYIEAWARKEGCLPVLGVDEAGRGCLAGPVVAAAVILSDPPRIQGLNDSKALTARTRERLETAIRAEALGFGICLIEAPRIDQVNILRASLEAMSAAVAQAVAGFGRDPGLVVVDGNMPIPGLPWSQKPWPKGDALSLNVAAASILAKVTRDRLMVEEEARYPGYGFAVHKGYGTPQHLEALQRLGPCALHRRTFAPVAAVLGVDSPAVREPGLF